jgi:hypothetical protein
MGVVQYLDIQGLHLYNSLRFRNSRSRHQSPSSKTKEHHVLVDETVRLMLIDVGEHLGLTSLKIHCYFPYQKQQHHRT